VTAEPHTSRDHVGDHDAADPHEDRRRDLSAAFGPPAAASLRGLLPPRPRRSTEETGGSTGENMAESIPEPTGEPTSPSVPVDEAPAPADPPAVPAPRRRSTTAGTARPAPAVAPGGGAGTGRRWGTARLASQEHVELLVLAALRAGPADGRELVARLRTDSGGGLTAPPTTVQRTLHHLLRRGLVERVADPDRRRLQLTDTGTRVLRARVRAWRALRRAVDAVLDAADVD
jgi:DNA-binding PadR family transcriptional regulator